MSLQAPGHSWPGQEPGEAGVPPSPPEGSRAPLSLGAVLFHVRRERSGHRYRIMDSSRMLPAVRFAHEDVARGAHGPTFGERLNRHVDGPRRQPVAARPVPSVRPRLARREVLPRRFRSSALRACGAGRLAIDIEAGFDSRNLPFIVTLSSHIADDDERSYPQFITTGSDGTCARGVPSNTRTMTQPPRETEVDWQGTANCRAIEAGTETRLGRVTRFSPESPIIRFPVSGPRT